jgi:MFS family permease
LTLSSILPNVVTVNLRQNQKLTVAVVYVAAMFMAIMDTTIVNVALPTLGRDFHARADSVGLVSIAYLVSLTVFIPASGWLGDLIGGRRALLGAIGLFTVASGLCGLSGSLGELIAFRVLQGAGGAVMTPVGLAMLFRVYPPTERVRVSSILAVVTALAPALGPILGGVFTTYLSWRLVFFVNVPIGLATLAFGLAALADHTPPHPGRLDVAGLVLSGLGLGALMAGISEGPSEGWRAAPVVTAIGAGALLLAAMVMVELRMARPLVDLRLFGNRLFAAATSLYALGSVAYLGALFLAARPSSADQRRAADRGRRDDRHDPGRAGHQPVAGPADHGRARPRHLASIHPQPSRLDGHHHQGADRPGLSHLQRRQAARRRRRRRPAVDRASRRSDPRAERPHGGESQRLPRRLSRRRRSRADRGAGRPHGQRHRRGRHHGPPAPAASALASAATRSTRPLISAVPLS